MDIKVFYFLPCDMELVILPRVVTIAEPKGVQCVTSAVSGRGEISLYKKRIPACVVSMTEGRLVTAV